MIESLVAKHYRAACMAELSAIKPGNVHIFADGHGMVVQDFIKSADVSMQVIAEPNLSVGERILSAVQATFDAVGCNTNLGIVLLAAPLIQASVQAKTLNQAAVQHVLNQLTVEDALNAFKAIRLASPAGLGEAPEHDVNASPNVTLLAAMQVAANRDLVAKQYANAYADIFGLGLASYEKALAKWQRPAWAVTAVYLAFLSEFEDSHIVRKYGKKIAQNIQQQARIYQHAFAAQENPKTYQTSLLAWDQSLKKQGINPGTSADLTVATLLAFELISA